MALPLIGTLLGLNLQLMSNNRDVCVQAVKISGYVQALEEQTLVALQNHDMPLVEHHLARIQELRKEWFEAAQSCLAN